MTLQELGSIGEFVSSLIMLVTLIYLALQLRALKKEAMLNSIVNNNQLSNDAALSITPEVAQIMAKASHDYASLEMWEQILLDQRMIAHANCLETICIHVDLGALAPDISSDELRARYAKTFVDTPGAIQCWEKHGDGYSGEWKEAVDQAIIELKGGT